MGLAASLQPGAFARSGFDGGAEHGGPRFVSGNSCKPARPSGISTEIVYLASPYALAALGFNQA